MHVFSCKFCHSFLMTTILQNTCEWLLLQNNCYKIQSFSTLLKCQFSEHRPILFLQHVSWTKEIGQQPPSPSNISYVVKQMTGKCYILAKYQVHLLFSPSSELFVTDNLFQDRYSFIFLAMLLSTSFLAGNSQTDSVFHLSKRKLLFKM